MIESDIALPEISVVPPPLVHDTEDMDVDNDSSLPRTYLSDGGSSCDTKHTSIVKTRVAEPEKEPSPLAIAQSILDDTRPVTSKPKKPRRKASSNPNPKSSVAGKSSCFVTWAGNP